ncbi:MAG TPA: hypothetical protein VN922_09810 [Bacteroidia bacterium]|nr:hypothetical protein [Bacteroidia bacterium]
MDSAENITDIRNESNWEITTKRYVAYIDIMGFKDMVARKSHEDMYMMMKEINHKALSNTKIEWLGLKQNLLKKTNYSDSIIIYSKDNSYDSLCSIIFSISALTNDLFTHNIPFKGSLAYGTMTLDDLSSIFFGQPLIDAYLLQDELLMYGVIVHATAEQEIERHRIEKKSFSFVNNYLCPLKNGNSTHYTIYPIFTAYYKFEETTKEIVDRCNELSLSIKKLRFHTSGHLRKYIDNTEKYLTDVREKTSKDDINTNDSYFFT